MQMYKGYNILNKSVNRDNLSSMLKVLSRAKDTMVNPRMMHFISEIVDPEHFPSKFIQTFKEKFESEVNARNRQRKLEWKQKQKTATEKKYFQERKIPKIEIIYSIESSWKDAPHPDENLAEHGEMIKVDYLHIHMMVIIDVGYNDYGYTELMICTNKAISRISGLQQVNYDGFTCYKDGKENHYGFFKPRDKKSTIKKGEYLNSYWHDLKLEFEDAVIRASYLCKTTQKVRLPEIFKRGNSFNISRPSRSAVKDILQAA
jgi:hypothetical protein